LDERTNLAQRADAVAGPEDIVRPSGIGDDDILGADVPIDR